MENQNIIVEENTVFSDQLTIQQARICGRGETFLRSRVKRPAACALLVYNCEQDALVLTRQFRYAIHSESGDHIYEIMAGITDEGETPENTAVREASEELGYGIKITALEKIADCFVSPGYSSEKLQLFYTEVANADRKSGGGGLPAEHEYIEVIHLKRTIFEELARKMQFRDAKTLIAGCWFLLNKSPLLTSGRHNG